MSHSLLLCGLAMFGNTVEPDTVAGKIHELGGVEVSASAASKPLTSSAPIHVLDAEKLKVTGVSDISDALHRMPGVTLRDYGGAGGLKTVSVRGFGAAHTAVVYDGITLSDCQSGQIDVSRYSLDNIGSLSMIIGDNDDIFIPARAAASAATLAVSSLTLPGFDDCRPHFTGQLRVGSFGNINPFFRIGKSFSERVAVAATGEFVHADNDYPFTLENGASTSRERRNNSKMNSGHAEIDAGVKLTARSSLKGKIYYYDNARRLPGPVIYYNDVNHEKLRERNFFAQLQYRNVVNSKWSFQGNAKFNWAASLYHDEKGIYPGGTLDQNYWQREAYVSGCALFMPDEKWAVDYSADYAYNNLNSNLNNDARPYRSSVLQSLTARYRRGGVSLMARALYSVYVNGANAGPDGRNASRLSPSVSVSWQPFGHRTFFLRASYKNIFRVPSFNEVYFDHYGSAELSPESTDQINVGATCLVPAASWLPELSMTVDGYLNHIKDKIVAIPYNMFVWQMINLGKVRMLGLDVTLNATVRLKPGQSLIFAGNYSYQRAQPRTDPSAADWMKQVAYTPLNSGGMSVSYENPWVNVVIHGTGVSARYAANSNAPETKIPGYMEFGVAAYRTFRLRDHSLEMRADLLNMFDKQYEVVARYPMPGRSWLFSVRYSFN